MLWELCNRLIMYCRQLVARRGQDTNRPATRSKITGGQLQGKPRMGQTRANPSDVAQLRGQSTFRRIAVLKDQPHHSATENYTMTE